MNVTNYKNAIENLENTIQDLKEIEDTKINLKSEKMKQILKEEYDYKSAYNYMKTLEQKNIQVLHFDELKKQEKINSIGITVFFTFSYLIMSLLVLFTPLSYGIVASLGSLAIIALSVIRYVNAIGPVKKLKKEIDSGERNLEQEIYEAQEKTRKIENKIENLKKNLELLKKDIENIQNVKTEIQMDVSNQKECLYTIIEELLQGIDLDEMMNQKMNRLESETIKEKRYSKKLEYKGN